MIIFPDALLLSEALTQPLTHARIGWHTYTFDLDALAVTVSGETADGPRDAPLQPETVQFWEPPSLPATWDLDFGSLRELDYVGLVANLGSVGCAVEARISEDVADFNDYLSLAGVDANYASTPDSVANSITGDLHVEIELAIDAADLPDFFLDFLGDFTASVTKITDDGTFARTGATATRVTSAGLVAGVAADVMRQDFHPITRAVRGLFVEESRVNICLQSQDFSTTWTNANTTESTNTTAAPDGTTTADTLIEASDTAQTHLISQSFTKAASALTYAFSMWVKPNGRTWFALQMQDGVNSATAYFQLTGSGTLGSNSANGAWVAVSSSVQAYPNGWYRITQVATTATSTTLLARIILGEADGDVTYNGDGTSGAYLWGAQLELGSFATSYIPTTTVSVTRAADVATIDDTASMGFNAAEGTLDVAFSYNVAASGRVAQFDDATANEQIRILCNTTTVSSQIVDGGSAVMNVAVLTGVTTDSAQCVALAYKANDSATAGNGGAATSDTSVTLPTITKFALGHVVGAQSLNGHIRTFDYYATRRVNATLQDFSRQTYRCLASKWAETSNQRSWALCLTEHCSLVLFVSTDGTAAGIREYHSAPLTFTEGVRFRVRVKLDILSGSDSVCTFQTSDDDGATWDTVGSAITQASVSGIFNSTAPVEVGAFNGGTSEFQGKVFQFWLHADLTDGPVIHFDAAEGETGDTSIVSEDTGETWTIHSTGPATALKIKRFSSPIAPGNDAPVMMLDDVRSARRLRLRFTGTTPPRLAVVYAGEALAMEREVDGNGFTPLTLSRETELTQPLSRGGQFLGQSFKRFGVKGSASFRHLDPDWYRANFDPFVEHARRYPYFFAWWPGDYPEEVGFAWTQRDIAPSYMGVREWMQVNWDMHGVGNE